MATLFTEIFDEFLMREIDSAKIMSYKIDFRYKLLSSLLLGAREVYRDVIYSTNGVALNKCEDVIEFQRVTYNYSTTNATFTQVLNPTPPTNSEFYVEVNGTQTVNFTYDPLTYTIVVNGLIGTSSIYISAYANGQFNQTVNLTEKGLFVRLMGVLYLRDKIKTDKLLCQSVYGKDWNMYSQANHLREIQAINEKEYDTIYKDMMLYTFRNSATHLKELGGAYGY